MINLFLEIQSVIRLFGKTSKKAIDIAFYSEKLNYFQYLSALFDKLSKEPGVSIAYITSDPKEYQFHLRDPAMPVYYLNHLLPYILCFLSAKVILMTMTDLHNYHLRRSTKSQYHVYVFHALISTHMIYREKAFDHYDAIFCAGPHHVKEIRMREHHAKLPKKKLIEFGYPLLDQMSKTFCEHSCKYTAQAKSGQSVFIAPSWAKDNIFKTCLKEMMYDLLNHDYKVVFRPHVVTKKSCAKELAALIKEFGGNPKVVIDLDDYLGDEFYNAAVLVTDWSGIALEYAFSTLRPILYINTPKKVNNPFYTDLNIEPIDITLREKIGLSIEMSDVKQINQTISHLIDKGESYRDSIQKLRDEVVFSSNHFNDGVEFILSAIHQNPSEDFFQHTKYKGGKQ